MQWNNQESREVLLVRYICNISNSISNICKKGVTPTLPPLAYTFRNSPQFSSFSESMEDDLLKTLAETEKTFVQTQKSNEPFQNENSVEESSLMEIANEAKEVFIAS